MWPDPDGPTRGLSFEPLDRSAPTAAAKDPALDERLALVDTLRGGAARERRAAVERLRALL